MPTGIRVTRRVDGTREFSTYEQKNSGEEEKKKAMMNNSLSSTTIIDNHTIDSIRKFVFQTNDDLTRVYENLEWAVVFLLSEESDCHMCPNGEPCSNKHIHVIKSRLTLVNPYYKQRLPPLRAVHCATCSKKLAYVCSGTNCGSSNICDLYCSDECQKANWDEHKLNCVEATTSNTASKSLNHGNCATNGSVNNLDIQNLTIQDRSSTPSISRHLPTTHANNVHCSPKKVAEQLNSSIVVRRSPTQPIVESNIQQDNISQVKPDVNLGNMRQPNALVRKVTRPIDPFASLPRGQVKPGRKYKTCVLSPDEHGNDRLIVYIPYDNDKLKDVMDIVNERLPDIEASGVSRNIDVGTTHMALSNDDGNWYRAMVVEIVSDGECKVYYIDFGSTETLPKANLRDIICKGLMLTDTPAIAIKCKFSQNSPENLIENALRCEDIFEMFVDTYDEANKLYVLTLI